MTPPRLPSPPEPVVEEDLFGWSLIGHYVGFVLRAPLRHKLLAASCFTIVLATALAALAVFPFRYQVQATVLAGYPVTGALAIPARQDRDTPTRAAREILQRRENLTALCRETQFVQKYIDKRPWAIRAKDFVIQKITGKERDPHELESSLVDTLQDRLWVSVSPEGAVTITFQWWDDRIAQDIVEAALQSFLDVRRAAEVKTVAEAMQILEGQKTRLEADIQNTIDAFEEKQKELRIPTPARRAAPGRPAGDPELGRLHAELAEHRRTVSDLETARQARLSQLQAQLLQQESVYAADHPALIATRREIDSLSDAPDKVRDLRGAISELEREISRRGGRVAVVAAAPGPDPYAEARSRLDTMDPRLDFERGQLGNLLRQHDDLRNRIEAARVEMETAEAAFKHRYSVITPPQLPRGPIKPYGIMFILGGVMGGIAFALFAATAADLTSGRVIERWQVEDQLELPVLAEIRR